MRLKYPLPHIEAKTDGHQDKRLRRRTQSHLPAIAYNIANKVLVFIMFAILIGALFTSCQKEDESFDETLLYGKWRSGNLFYRYLSNGSGKTWDEGDDVYEDEAQNFSWTLEKSEFTHIYVMEIGGVVPKVYKLTELTATSLKYQDDFGKRFSFVKVSN